jgi:iron complex outermembrane receptor protein
MRLTYPILLGAGAFASLNFGALAQTQSSLVVQAERYVVTETALVANATGMTQVRTSDVTPVAARAFAGLADNIANLHVNASGAGSFGGLISLRGLSNTPYFGDPSVAVYFDDIPLGNAFTFPTDLFGFSSATVWRGPQPAAAGRAAEGGLIQFSSAALQEVAAGTLRAGVGNHDARQAALEYRTASGSKADASVAASYSERAGYIENTQLHTKVDDQQATSAAARVRLRPTPGSEVTLQVLVNEHRDGAQPLVPANGPLYSVARGREGSTHSLFQGGALKLAFDTVLGRLSSTTSRTRWTLDPYENRLVLPPPLDSQLSQTQSAWNEELRLGTDSRDAVAWHTGAWFSDTNTNGAVNRAIPGLFPIERSSFALTAHTQAVFGDITLPAGSWRFTGSLRAEQVKKDFARSETVPASGHFVANRSDGALLPEVSASLAINPTTSAAFSIGYGHKPGGWSAYTDNPVLAAFRPEKAIAYEAGVDSWLANHTVNFAARVFDYEVRDYQIERSFNRTDYLVVNAPRARSTGGELEASWHPLPEWMINGSLGVSDTTLREFTDPFSGRNYSGRRAPYTPNYDGHLGVTYHSTLGWFAIADLVAIGRTYYDESEALAFASPAHVTGNLQLGYEAPRWRVTAHVENVTDVQYRSLVIPGVGHVVPGAPRTYGVEVALKW